MSDLQELIATSTIRAYNQGVRDESERTIRLLEAMVDTKAIEADALTRVLETIKGDK